MSIALINIKSHAAMMCALCETLKYESPQEAYDAYIKCTFQSEKTLDELKIVFHGDRPKGLIYGRDLVDHIEYLFCIASLGIEYLTDTIDGKNQLLTENHEKIMMEIITEREPENIS